MQWESHATIAHPRKVLATASLDGSPGARRSGRSGSLSTILKLYAVPHGRLFPTCAGTTRRGVNQDCEAMVVGGTRGCHGKYGEMVRNGKTWHQQSLELMRRIRKGTPRPMLGRAMMSSKACRTSGLGFPLSSFGA